MKVSGKLSQISFVITHEFHTISTSYAALLVLMGGILVYGLLYNYMYASNIVTDAPIAVVDNSHSNLSRQYVRQLDVTPQVAVYAQAMNHREAHEWMKEGRVQGILYIPYDFETRVLRRREAVFSLYVTTGTFLYFKALQEATSRIYFTLNDAHHTGGTVFLPPQGLLTVMMARPANMAGTVLCNHIGGYSSYLIPVAMMIIIFQTLLMVISILTGDEYRYRTTEPSLPGFRTTGKDGLWGAATRLVVGKTFVYCGLYAIFSMFLLGLLPHFFSIPNIGGGLYIIAMMVPYLMAASFFGLAASCFFTDSETLLLMIAFFSVGLIFLSGVSYPLELMPQYWRMMHYIIPAAPATLAFVKLNPTRADMADVQPEYITLWIQVIVYFGLNVWIYKKKLEA